VQSIVITHLPQIASRAERHFAVRKEQSELDTISTIEELSGEKRERELVEMSGLRGEEWKGRN
jgi:DNA repair protein RecN (Recombination protein N)